MFWSGPRSLVLRVCFCLFVIKSGLTILSVRGFWSSMSVLIFCCENWSVSNYKETSLEEMINKKPKYVCTGVFELEYCVETTVQQQVQSWHFTVPTWVFGSAPTHSGDFLMFIHDYHDMRTIGCMRSDNWSWAKVEDSKFFRIIETKNQTRGWAASRNQSEAVMSDSKLQK